MTGLVCQVDFPRDLAGQARLAAWLANPTVDGSADAWRGFAFLHSTVLVAGARALGRYSTIRSDGRASIGDLEDPPHPNAAAQHLAMSSGNAAAVVVGAIDPGGFDAAVRRGVLSSDLSFGAGEAAALPTLAIVGIVAIAVTGGTIALCYAAAQAGRVLDRASDRMTRLQRYALAQRSVAGALASRAASGSSAALSDVERAALDELRASAAAVAAEPHGRAPGDHDGISLGAGLGLGALAVAAGAYLLLEGT